MRISAKVLENVSSVNSYKYANQVYLVEGSINEVYIQLVDLSKTAELSPNSKVLPDNPLRYMSQATTFSVTATFPSIDDAKIITVIGIQPFADDKSIFKFILPSTDTPASGSFSVNLVEDGNIKKINILNAISIEVSEVGGC